VRYSEFQMSAHMPLPSDELFDVASDPARMDRWIPTDLGPRARAQRWDSKPGAGVVRSRDQRRVEWCTVREGCHTALQVYPAGRGSRVTIHVCMPQSHDGQPPVDPQLRQALRRLKRMAAPNSEPRAPDVESQVLTYGRIDSAKSSPVRSRPGRASRKVHDRQSYGSHRGKMG